MTYKKFDTMFKVLDYDRTIDLTSLKTDEAIKTTISYIQNCDSLKQEVSTSLSMMKKYEKKTYKFFEASLMKIIIWLMAVLKFRVSVSWLTFFTVLW